jgi:hypothetical protein
MKFLIGLTILLAVLVACAQPLGGEPTVPPEDTPGLSARETAAEDRGAMSGGLPEELLGDILADASERSGLTANDLEVLTAEAASWNDGSLGCPEPGQMYTQALVDGYHVVVRAADEELDYRVGNGGFRLCENPTAPVDGTKPSD